MTTAVTAAARFEGSYLGDAARIPATARMECKICWHVYDPAEGCSYWQVPAGTPFAALPHDWRCPVCDGAPEQFMRLDDGASPPAAQAPRPAFADMARALEAAFREIHIGQMRGVPLVNEALGVKAVGFRAWEGRGLGVLVTPWFMNLVLLPGPDDDWSGLAAGAKELVEFPSGHYEFVHAVRAEVGPYKACSLFSPMFEFTTMLQATDTADAVLVALFDPSIREEGSRSDEIRRRAEAPPEPASPSEPEPAAGLSRRTLLRGSAATPHA